MQSHIPGSAPPNPHLRIPASGAGLEPSLPDARFRISAPGCRPGFRIGLRPSGAARGGGEVPRCVMECHDSSWRSGLAPSATPCRPGPRSGAGVRGDKGGIGCVMKCHDVSGIVMSGHGRPMARPRCPARDSGRSALPPSFRPKRSEWRNLAGDGGRAEAQPCGVAAAFRGSADRVSPLRLCSGQASPPRPGAGAPVEIACPERSRRDGRGRRCDVSWNVMKCHVPLRSAVMARRAAALTGAGAPAVFPLPPPGSLFI